MIMTSYKGSTLSDYMSELLIRRNVGWCEISSRSHTWDEIAITGTWVSNGQNVYEYREED